MILGIVPGACGPLLEALGHNQVHLSDGRIIERGPIGQFDVATTLLGQRPQVVVQARQGSRGVVTDLDGAVVLGTDHVQAAQHRFPVEELEGVAAAVADIDEHLTLGELANRLAAADPQPALAVRVGPLDRPLDLSP